jgi:5-methylcytosine-specific restriction endonuclease McrA
MKSEAVIREICGTESGYRKHKNSNEEKCAACKVAWNAWRRDYARRNPTKNSSYRRTYAQRHPDRVKAQIQKYLLPPEVKAAKAAFRAELAAAKAQLLLEEKQRKAAEKEALKAQKAAEHKARMEANAIERARKVAEYRAQKAAREQAEREERQRERAYQKAIRRDSALTEVELIAAKQGKQEAKEAARLRRPVLHGTTGTEYGWCRKQNGTACKPCRAAAAEYARNRPNKKRYYTVSNKNRREYAKLNGRESYTREQVLLRDNYTCHICDEPTDPTATHIMGQPGWERYPHIDHVIPLSRGGSDTLDNVRTAHAECNLLKGHSVDTPEITV